MRHAKAAFLLAALLIAGLPAQERDAGAEVGYMRIFTDADLVQIFLDGEAIGYSPILEKIPVTPGWHVVSFFSPDFRWDHSTLRQRRVLINVVEAGTQNVHVKPGELVEVHMAWHDLEREIDRYESGKVITAVVGMAMVTAMLIILALAS